jgi:hypothetical protein
MPAPENRRREPERIYVIGKRAACLLRPERTPWLQDYIRELTSFRGTKYDDEVDSTTEALHYLSGTHSLEVWIRLGERSRSDCSFGVRAITAHSIS